MITRGIIGALLVLLVSGCGASDVDQARAERERARLQLEEKARRDAEAANKAITDLNKKMFGQKPAEPPPATPPLVEKR